MLSWIDKKYIPRAIETLNASEILWIGKNYLKHISDADVLVELSEELVHIKASFTVSNLEKISELLDIKNCQ